MSGEFQYILAEYPKDKHLLKRAYDEIMLTNFPRDELDPWEEWVKMFTEPELVHVNIQLAFDSKDTKLEKILGLTAFEYYQPANSFLLSYLVVVPEARGRGLSQLQTISAWKMMQEIAQKWGHKEPYQIFVECEKVGFQPEDGAHDPCERLRSFQHMGVRFLQDFEYVHPPLEIGEEVNLNLLLGVIVLPSTKTENRRPYIPAEHVRMFLKTFYMDCAENIKGDFTELPAYQGMMEQLENKERVWLGEVKLPERKRTKHKVSRQSTKSTGSKRSDNHVIIVGAGLAGLACAQQLQHAGMTVTVLEGRHRVGGRVYTGRSWETSVDHGASFIHGIDKNPLYDIATDLPAARLYKVFEENTTMFGKDGKPLSKLALMKGILRFEALYEVLKQKAEFEPHTSNFMGFSRRVLEDNPKLGPQDEEEKEVFSYAFSQFESVENCRLAEWTAKYIDYDKEYEGGDHVFVSGFGSVARELAKGLNVLKDHTVVTVDLNTQGKVKVVCHEGSVFVGDYVVVTVPLGVLQKRAIEFSPTLPTPMITAIDSLGMGTLEKVILRFPHIFWTMESDWIGFNHKLGKTIANDEPPPFRLRENCWFYNTAASFPEPRPAILTCLVSGDLAQSLLEMTDDKIIERVMQSLRAMYGSDIPSPVDYSATRWAEDPFSHGSYCYMRAGSTPDHRASLQEPVSCPQGSKRLYLAGEHCSPSRMGYADGAFDSGKQAAAAIQKDALAAKKVHVAAKL